MHARTLCMMFGMVFGLGLIAAPFSSFAVDEGPEELETCRDAVKHYATALKTELRTAMQEGGPTAAVKVCERAAGPIALEIGEERGLSIGRTSDRLRNPQNAPDEWESQILESFVERNGAGETYAAMEDWTITTSEDGSRQLRYMKAIGISPICMRCHGEKVHPDILSAIGEFYPEDRATGFRPGDLRGAFTASLPLDAEE